MSTIPSVRTKYRVLDVLLRPVITLLETPANGFPTGCATRFMEETAGVRKSVGNIIVTVDRYGAHISFLTVNLFGKNNVVVVYLPAHRLHCTQTLDYWVFSAFKTYFRKSVNDVRKLTADF